MGTLQREVPEVAQTDVDAQGEGPLDGEGYSQVHRQGASPQARQGERGTKRMRNRATSNQHTSVRILFALCFFFLLFPFPSSSSLTKALFTHTLYGFSLSLIFQLDLRHMVSRAHDPVAKDYYR